MKNYIVLGGFATLLLAIGFVGGSNGFFLDLVFLVVTTCLAAYMLSVPRQLLKENGILCSGAKEPDQSSDRKGRKLIHRNQRKGIEKRER